ncbi:MAG TPA: DinB family protein [Puia sp.]|jgi:hypothetical protein|nr:DinB family protein [Puia sp.]
MSFHHKTFSVTIILSFALLSVCSGQQPAKFSIAVERLFNKIENDILTSAQAMPEDRFYFTPEDLQIKNSNFKGVRTFAGQIMHLATDNILIWSAITGDSVRNDIQDVNGPASIKTKNDVIKYLKSSFDEGHKAVSMLTEKNAMDMIEFRGRKLPKLDLAFYGLTHANEHYGQMVVYLRMCGIIPPPTINER